MLLPCLVILLGKAKKMGDNCDVSIKYALTTILQKLSVLKASCLTETKLMKWKKLDLFDLDCLADIIGSL